MSVFVLYSGVFFCCFIDIKHDPIPYLLSLDALQFYYFNFSKQLKCLLFLFSGHTLFSFSIKLEIYVPGIVLIHSVQTME